MKKFTLALLAATALAGTAAPALAQQGWQSINERQARLDQRIDAGVRNGRLTQAEARTLRNEFRDLQRLEAQYRASVGGLSFAERADLDRRFDALSRRIRDERNDGQDRGDRGWQSINQRQAQLEQRIEAGIRNGSLTRAEAVRLRAEFRQISQLEASYRRSGNGLTQAERADLDRRFDALERKIRRDRNDGQDRGWQNINQRQAELDRRIDAGVSNGSLTRAEAVRLRAEFREISQLEASYRRSGNGLTQAERADLDRRFDALERKIRRDRNDGQDRGWQNINQRQAELDRRIDAGVSNGSLTRAEAVRLRAEFREIAQLEAAYRRSGNGLTQAERADLDRRFDALERKIRRDRNDGQDRGDRWQGINARQAELDRRIDAGVRARQLSAAEAASLRAEFRQIAALEATYRRSGNTLTRAERQDLDNRFDRLAARIRWERSDWQRRYW